MAFEAILLISFSVLTELRAFLLFKAIRFLLLLHSHGIGSQWGRQEKAKNQISE
jgi:hypothetical protein